MNKDRIAIIVNSLSLGGAERVSLILAEWMTNENIETFLITLNKDREEGYELQSTINRVPINYDSTLTKIEIIKELRRELKFNNINKVLVMGVPLSVYVVPASLGLDITVTISERNDPANFKGKWTTKLLSRSLMVFADRFIFQTKQAKSYYPKFIQKKSTVIPNPILVESIPQKIKGNRAKRIVTAGRLVPQKNHELLIRAFSEVKNFYPEHTLTIYGNGKDRNKLEVLIKDLRLSNKVFLPGATKQLFSEMIKAEIFVLSSDFEGMPNALIEALAIGIPCISTDCPSGGPKDIINNMHNGILVPTNNIQELANAMMLLLGSSELKNKFSTNSVGIRKTLDRDRICNKFKNFITEKI